MCEEGGGGRKDRLADVSARLTEYRQMYPGIDIRKVGSCRRDERDSETPGWVGGRERRRKKKECQSISFQLLRAWTTSIGSPTNGFLATVAVHQSSRSADTALDYSFAAASGT